MFGSARSWLVVCAFTIVVVGLFVWSYTAATGPSAESVSFANELGMRVLCAKGRYSVCVKSLQRPTDGVAFAAHEQKITVIDIPAENGGADGKLRDIQFTFGDSFSVSCLYRPSAAGAVSELKLMLEDFGLVDLNADGRWDMRIWYPPKTRVEVFLNGDWREVTLEDGTEDRRKLVDGGFVRYHTDLGSWELDE